MKILLISAFFPPETGSAAHLFYELGYTLKARGHKVTVLTGLPRYHVLKQQKQYRRRPVIAETYHGLRVYRALNMDIPWNVPLLRGVDQFFTAFSFGVAGSFLPEADISLVYSPPLPLALAALGLSRLHGNTAVLNVQDIFPQSAIDLGILKNPFLIKFFKSLESFLYKNFPRIICHSEGNRDYIISRGGHPQRVAVVPNWVDTDTTRPADKNNKIWADLDLKNHFVISFAGIMGYSQDLDTVLDSAAMLQDQQNIVFLLVGDGVEKPRLQKIAREKELHNVIFLPMQPKEEYLQILAVSDLCLVTLKNEVKTPVVPSKILSIMAAGRPILASLPLNGDAPRLLAAARAGLSIPPESPTFMTDTILKLYQDPKKLKKMGSAGREYAVNHLSLDVCVTQLEKLFAQVIARHRPHPSGKVIPLSL